MSARTWRAGWRYVAVPLGLGAVRLARRRRGGVAGLLAATGVALFFRDPERPLLADPALLYSAADGVVKSVERVRDPWLPEGEALRISTFLSVFDVHVNRSPVAGTLRRTESIRGHFKPAFMSSASNENRRDRLLVETARGPVVVVLAAGILARTISRWVEVPDRVAAGERVALIHFGSRTDVLIAADAADPIVAPGTRVRAGRTPIARYRSLAGQQERQHAADEERAAGHVDGIPVADRAREEEEAAEEEQQPSPELQLPPGTRHEPRSNGSGRRGEFT